MADRDPEVPEADAIEQRQLVQDAPRVNPMSSDPEVPDDDALDQAREVPYDEDE